VEIESEIINSIGKPAKTALTQQSIADKCGISVQSISRIVNKMEQSGRIIKNKDGRRNTYSLPITTETHRYEIAGLTEDKVYKDIVAGFIRGVPERAKKSFEYAFTEIMNNAIEHSSGIEVEVSLIRDECSLLYAITDDGVGIFTKVADALSLDEKHYAILELAKGKFTTDPANHTGEGIFFSSKCGDLFVLESDGIEFISNPDIEMLNVPLKQNIHTGTRVIFKVYMDREQTLSELFDQYTDGPDSYGFSKTVIPIQLLEYGDEEPVFVSRSQARRLLARVERFKVVSLDFSGIDSIGQGFADEIFRVFKASHPDVVLIPTKCTNAVDKMIRHVLAYLSK